MLDCKRNRLDYGELLCPPSGYQLDRAVATTYSVDLGTLLSIPISLVYAQTMEGDFSGARFQLLEAIKKFSSKVKVYHQMGQLHVQAKQNWLYAYLEDALVPILPNDAFTAFHPKVWIIRFTAMEEEVDLPTFFRVIVLSRNLTFDRSWDVAACLEGELGSSVQESNRPLTDFVRWLHAQSPIAEVEQFLGELERVNFTTPHPFESHAFHPIGLPGYETNPVGEQKADKTLAMSPFLHEVAIQQLRDNTKHRLRLFSERRELEKMPVKLLKQIRCHHLSDLIVEGEGLEAAEEGATDVQQQNLHAKLFLFEDKEETRWFLGSANATKAALNKNVEFMVEMRGNASATRIRPRLKELMGEGEDNGPFISFDPELAGKDDSEEGAKQQESRLFEYALMKSEVRGRVEQAENGKNFDLHISLDLGKVPSKSNLKLTIQPFNSKQVAQKVQPGSKQVCIFRNIIEVELSRFLHVRIEVIGGELQHEFLWRIEIDGLPQDRLENILKKIINSEDKFFEYLRFLLADEITKEDLIASIEDDDPHSQSGYDSDESAHFNLPIYEQLLVVASRTPRKLAEVDEIIRHLAGDENGNECVIPETFLSFWETFRAFIPKKEKEKV